MGIYDKELQDIENSMNDNIQRLSALLNELSINDLYRETDAIRQLHNQQVNEYNRLTGETFSGAPELNEELTRTELLQRYIELYKEGNQLAIIIKSSKETEKAMEEYSRVVENKPIKKDAREDVSHHSTPQTPFQHQIVTLCQEYGECYETQQTIMVAKEMEEEMNASLEKYNELTSSFNIGKK